MKRWQCFFKRTFDLCVSAFGLLAIGWLILLCWVIASLDTRQNGMFTQIRIGKNGRPFRIFKIRTMRPVEGITTVVTCLDDPRITWIGKWFRRLKLDELPQLINVFFGHMSLVGPRPDVAYYAELLQGEDRIIQSVRPGITGPATLAFRNEEELLLKSDDPEKYNDEVIFPAKVKINRQYIEQYRFSKDIFFIFATVLPGLTRRFSRVFNCNEWWNYEKFLQDSPL